MENNITYDIRKIGDYLESQGWKRSVAGEENFAAGMGVITKALDTGLGIIVSGEYGVGKTTFADAAARSFGHFRRVDLGDSGDADKLTGAWMEMWAEDLFAENVLLDDVGAESGHNEYGVRTELVAEFIVKFHNRNRDSGPRLFITTNLNSEQIDARYGGRLYSRLKDLCVPFRLEGKDKRKWTKGGAA